MAMTHAAPVAERAPHRGTWRAARTAVLAAGLLAALVLSTLPPDYVFLPESVLVSAGVAGAAGAAWWVLGRPHAATNLTRAVAGLAVGYGLVRGLLIVWARGSTSLKPASLLIGALAVAGAVAVSEEVAFRGFLFRLAARAGLAVALTVQAAAFAAVHLFSTSWHFIPVLFVDALVFGLLFVVSSRLLTGILCHAVLNGVVLMTYGSRFDIGEGMTWTYVGLSLLAGAVALAALIPRLAATRTGGRP